MGKISDSMQNTVDDIKSSAENRRFLAENRHIKLSEMNTDARDLMKRFHMERRDMANAQKEKLSSDNAARKDSTQQLMNDINKFMDSVRSDLQSMVDTLEKKLSSDEEIRKEANQKLIIDIRSFIQSKANALKEKLSSDGAARKDVAQRFMNDVRADIRDMSSALVKKLSLDGIALRESVQQHMDELISDRSEARKIWKQLFGNGGENIEKPAEPGPIKESIAAVVPTLEGQMLEVIAKHPEGIKLVDIGNAIGVDWRGLIGAIKLLVDEGKTEKIDTLYYPTS